MWRRNPDRLKSNIFGGPHAKILSIRYVNHPDRICRRHCIRRRRPRHAGSGDHRIEAIRLADIFRANVVDSTLSSFVFEITGTPQKIDAFADLMRPLGLQEIARTGVAALARGTL